MLLKERARHVEHARAIHPQLFGLRLHALAHVHAKGAGQFVEVGAIKERMRQSVHEPQRRVVARLHERLVEQEALVVRHGIVGQPGETTAHLS